MTNHALCDGVKAGDKESLLQIDSMVRRIFTRRLRIKFPNDFEDLLQEIWLRVVESIRANRLSDPKKLWSYAWGIAMNVGHSETGRCVRYCGREINDLDYTQVDSIETLLINKEREYEIRRRIRSLTPQRREILSRTLDGQESTEICEAMGIGIKILWVEKHRGMQRIRAMVGAQ